MVDSRASHAGLTSEYAAIPQEMKILSGYFDKELLSQVAESEFYAAIPALRSLAGDRAVLRAIHFIRRTNESRNRSPPWRREILTNFCVWSGYPATLLTCICRTSFQPAPWRIRSWA